MLFYVNVVCTFMVNIKRENTHVRVSKDIRMVRAFYQWNRIRNRFWPQYHRPWTKWILNEYTECCRTNEMCVCVCVWFGFVVEWMLIYVFETLAPHMELLAYVYCGSRIEQQASKQVSMHAAACLWAITRFISFAYISCHLWPSLSMHVRIPSRTDIPFVQNTKSDNSISFARCLCLYVFHLFYSAITLRFEVPHFSTHLFIHLDILS